MWSEHFTVNQQPPWGTYVNDLAAEADLITQRSAYAALLDCMGVIRVSGEEAASFLQGQITCDINQIDQTNALLGAHCNPKGRAQATFLCAKSDQDYFLLLPKDQIAATTQALSKFALFSKAELSECPDLLVIGFGQHAPGGELTGLTEFHNDSLGWLGLIPKDSASECLQQIQSKAITIVGDNAWQLDLIRAGVPLITLSQSEQWIPQEINYDLINGVSFKKGCYKGQEIIARIHYRGQTKVRTYPLEITDAADLSIGDKIVSDFGQGTILAAARVSERTLNVLSTLKIEASASENLKLEQNDGCQIRVLPLPYAIT